MSPITSPDEMGTFDVLDDEHEQVFRKALIKILSTGVAEYTYAQILNGLPTEESLRDSYVWMRGHPVYELNHTELCGDFLTKAREFRTRFEPSELIFKQSLFHSFQDTNPNSKEFNLRLIELVVVACHQIAAYLYELDAGAHKHQLFADWLEKELPEAKNGMHRSGWALPPAAFFHRFYRYPEQYPRGLADVAGYWAEGKIFGGVVVFDRGETERECRSMWIHGDRVDGPRTLYPPISEQFEALVNFLLSGPDQEYLCPLPIHGTPQNRPRWDPYDALAEFHIFRDRYERKLVPKPPQGRTASSQDWPEYADEIFIASQMYARQWGEPFDADAMAAAQERLEHVTPSSPCWRPR